jgi:hypothetical protein
MSATAGAAGRVKPWRIAVSLAMSSLMTESVIDHAGPVSDHPNPVIDHKVLTEAITNNSRRPCPLSADITSHRSLARRSKFPLSGAGTPPPRLIVLPTSAQ